MAKGWVPECPVRVWVIGDPPRSGGPPQRFHFLMSEELLIDLLAQGRAARLRLWQLGRQRASTKTTDEEVIDAAPWTHPQSDRAADLNLLVRIRRSLEKI